MNYLIFYSQDNYHIIYLKLFVITSYSIHYTKLYDFREASNRPAVQPAVEVTTSKSFID